MRDWLIERTRIVSKATASPILQLIRRTAEDLRAREMTDQDLLQSFHAQQDQAAFHALLRRHGPMVLDVCRGTLGNEADAEDAFQATFLILARKAGSIRRAASLGSWLHGVAYRIALKARAQSATRQKHEARTPGPKAAEPDDLSWREVRQVLHEEVSRLPERYRAPLVLCYLEGATQDAAAVQLKLAKSTLRERLERGRALLRTRLMHRGLGPAAVLVAGAWPIANLSASMQAFIVSSTVKAATLFAAGRTAAVGLISAKAAALTEGVLQAMVLSKIKVATALVLVTVAVSVGGNQLLVWTRAAAGSDEAKLVQQKKLQPPSQKDQPGIEVVERERAFAFHYLTVRDPSSGEYKPLTRGDGIPVLKGHIEFHVKKLKEANDDKSIREALKGLEESTQNMKDLLSLPSQPKRIQIYPEKKPEDKKPAKKKPTPRPENGGDTWEMEARRLLANSNSPRCLPWDTGDTWEMNDFWHFSPWADSDIWKWTTPRPPWGKSDTWEWTTPRRIEKGAFWMFRRST